MVVLIGLVGAFLDVMIVIVFEFPAALCFSFLCFGILASVQATDVMVGYGCSL